MLLLPTLTLAVLTVPFVAASGHGGGIVRRHHQELARRAKADVDLFKRESPFCGTGSYRYTWYDVGLGACGQTNVPSDFIVAMSQDDFGSSYPGPHCFKMIDITIGGKTARAQIMDRCVACPSCGLDFSKGLFEYFADVGAGVLEGSWTYVGDEAPAPSSTPPPAPSTSSTPPPPPPTSSSTPPPPPPSSSSSFTPSSSVPPSSSQASSSAADSTSKDSSSSTPASPTSTSTSTPDLSTGAASGLAVATGAAFQAQPGNSSPGSSNGNLNGINMELISVGGLVAAAAKHGSSSA